jgi:hypothetical protein
LEKVPTALTSTVFTINNFTLEQSNKLSYCISSIQWPITRINSQYFILDIPYLPISILHDALGYISGHCYYRETGNHARFLKFPGIEPTEASNCSEHIMLENLFLEPDLRGANDPKNTDMYRFQTTPSVHDQLMTCSAIAAIVDTVAAVIEHMTDMPYSVHKVSVLFSRPHGPEQGLHVDDARDMTTIEEEGDLLSAIVALMSNMKLDIGTVNNGRKTFQIPVGGMILMSGRCVHGDSSYSVCNTRIHIEFIPNSSGTNMSLAQNTVGTRYLCPLETCTHRKEGKSFLIENKLYYHWQKEHLKNGTVKLSLKKFIHAKNGGTLVTCSTCGKGYKTKKLLSRHMCHCA